MTFSVVPARTTHTTGLASRLRRADRVEVLCVSGRACTDALLAEMVARSRVAFTGLVDSRVEGLVGVGDHPLDPTWGVPWLLLTDHLLATPERRRQFINLTRPLLQALALPGYEHLTNFALASNRTTLRWLRHAGFELYEGTTEIGGRVFRGFTKPCAH